VPDEWAESTEGSLDPDLTEEAGYAYWDPPERTFWRRAFRTLLVVTLLMLVGGALAVLIR
jgi:hypothetical protein